MGGPASSSSGEEDGDAEWKAAIDSVAPVTTTATSNGFAAASKDLTTSIDGTNSNQKPQNLKHYQIKVSLYLHPHHILLHIFIFALKIVDFEKLDRRPKQGMLKFE